MARMIIQVNPDASGGLSVRLLRGPTAPRDRAPRAFACLASELPTGQPPPPPPGWVSAYGQRLWQGLTAHPEVQSALDQALRLPSGELQEVLFDLQHEGAELFNWEMLCDADGRFLALDPRWPIGRIAEAGTDRAGAIPRYSPPLRLVAVLSALGAKARYEWEGLYQAVRQARGRGLAVSLHVLVGEADLLEDIAEVAQRDPQVTAEQVPDSAEDVRRIIRDTQPQLLHFFCHGSAGQGQPRLLLATAQDFEQAQEREGVTPRVVLQLADLQNLLLAPEVWLVVLNCCEGAMAAAEVNSLAHSLVANGVPAALGMREAVPARAANEFSRVLYNELLTELGEQLRPPAGGDDEVELDWAKVLHAPRRALVEQYNTDATTYREWTLPVLYIRPEPYRVRVLAPSATPAQPQVELTGPTVDRVADAILEGLLQRLPPDAPSSAVAELRNAIVAANGGEATAATPAATTEPVSSGPGSD